MRERPCRRPSSPSLDLHLTSQFAFRAGPAERRADLILLVNGIPLVLIEAKTPVRRAISWLDGAIQVHEDYERHVPELFVANVFSLAADGKELKYGAVRMPVDLWGPWRGDDQAAPGSSARPGACSTTATTSSSW